jgi:hypothetical protein
VRQRIKRFNVGDHVILHGQTGVVEEAHCDPHPEAFSHCSGNSARYVVRFADGPQTCWDWQLSPAADFKHPSPSIVDLFQCKPSKNSDLTPKDATPAA